MCPWRRGSACSKVDGGSRDEGVAAVAQGRALGCIRLAPAESTRGHTACLRGRLRVVSATPFNTENFKTIKLIAPGLIALKREAHDRRRSQPDVEPKGD